MYTSVYDGANVIFTSTRLYVTVLGPYSSGKEVHNVPAICIKLRMQLLSIKHINCAHNSPLTLLRCLSSSSVSTIFNLKKKMYCFCFALRSWQDCLN